MREIKTIICDDEKHARSRLKKIILKHSNIAIIAECSNGQEAFDKITELKPDLVFLDIQMPDLTGIEVLERLKSERLPQIIFLSAYDRFAIKAFELCALDYILKPYEDSRINQSLSRVFKQVDENVKKQLSDNLISLVQHYKNLASEFTEEILVKDKNREVKIDCRNILFMQSFSNYIELHLMDQKYLYRSSLNDVEKSFNPDSFIRIHRSFILNKNYVKSLKYLGNNEYEFLLINDKKLKSGRNYSKLISASKSEFL